MSATSNADVVNNNPRNDKERYLCISDGFVIHLLDLNRSKNQSIWSFNDVPTLNLLEKGLPISAGLFKLGSDVLIIGGRELPTFDNTPNNWVLNILASLSKKNGLSGTSCIAYRLSLVDDNLSLSKCDYIKPLNSPKGWPKVENLGNKLHVMECFPAEFDYWHTPIPTHEVLDLNDLYGGWVRVNTGYTHGSVNSGVRIWAHIVVGDWIHALGYGEKGYNPKPSYAMVFDTKTESWTRCDRRSESVNPFSINHVTDIFEFGRGKCVGEFLREEFSDSLYVIFAIVEDKGESPSVHAVAYLVDLTGQVLCFERVPDFFEGHVGPASVIDSTVIDVDVDVEEKKMCAVIDGKPCGNIATRCLFVNTFSIEVLSDSGSRIRELWRGRIGSQEAGPQNFVRVVVKDRYVYETESDNGVGVTRMQACFL